MCSWGYVWQSQRRDSCQKGVPSWGGKRGSGSSTHLLGRVLAWLLLQREFFKCQILYLWKSFCEVGLSQLLCVDWLLAWNVVSSQAGLSSLTRGHLGMCSGGPSVFYPKQHLAAQPSPLPTDHWIYSDGLSPLTSVW